MRHEIPQGWELINLSKFTHEIRARHTGVGNIPILSMTKYDGFIDSLEYFKKRIFSKNTEKYKLVKRGQFAYATIHLDEGSIDLLDKFEAGLISPMYTVFEPDMDKVDHLFLRYLLKSELMIKLYGRLGQGSINRRKSIGFKILGSIEVALPPLPEQKKIAAILSSVDYAIQATQAVIDQTHRVKQGLLQQLLTRGIGHTRFKQTEIGEIPEKWKVYTIGESCSVENNQRKPINAKTREQMKGSYPYYGPTGIIDYINEYRLEGKYVLIGEDGDHFLKYNDWSMTQLVVGKFNVNNHAHVIRGINDCSTEWIFHYFRHRDIISNLTRQGAGRYKLKKATLVELPIVVPPLNEQKKICAFLDSIDLTQESSVNELNHFKVIKRGLMQDLLTGRVRVNGVK